MVRLASVVATDRQYKSFNQTKIAMHTLQLIQIGHSVGVILPTEVLSQLQLGVGSEIFLTESSNAMFLTTCNPESETQMRVAREVMGSRCVVLRELTR